MSLLKLQDKEYIYGHNMKLVIVSHAYLQGLSQSCDTQLYVGTLLGTIIVPIFHLDVHTMNIL